MPLWVTLVIIIIAVIIISVVLMSMQPNQPKRKTWSLEPLVQAEPCCMKRYRPWCEDDPGNYWGAFKVDRNTSWDLDVTSSGYYEVDVYAYPSWECVHADTNIRQLSFDAFEPGTYVVIISSVKDVDGTFTRCLRRGRSVSVARHHRASNAHLQSRVADVIAQCQQHVVRNNLYFQQEDFCSQPVQMFPPLACTKIESLTLQPGHHVVVSSEPVSGEGQETLFCQNGLTAVLVNSEESRTYTQINENTTDEMLPIYAYRCA